MTLASHREMGKELRQCVVDTLSQLMQENQRIIALDADLGAASGWTQLSRMNSERFINAGIAEANMVGVAAGLSLQGFVPFIHTFGPFATRRVFDQLYISGGYSHNTINIYGSDPGFCVGPNGGTHTTWEDVALMRMIPHSVVCDAADEVQMEWLIRAFNQRSGIHYVRGNRKAVHQIYQPDTTFEIGKGNVLNLGDDLLIIATGQLVYEALEVADYLSQEGLLATVIDMFTIKPLDQALILKHAKGKRLIVTCENHSITGGLGSAVAEVIAESQLNIRLKRIGVNERFGQVGTPAFLQAEYGLTTERILEQIKQTL